MIPVKPMPHGYALQSRSREPISQPEALPKTPFKRHAPGPLRLCGPSPIRSKCLADLVLLKVMPELVPDLRRQPRPLLKGCCHCRNSNPDRIARWDLDFINTAPSCSNKAFYIV